MLEFCLPGLNVFLCLRTNPTFLLQKCVIKLLQLLYILHSTAFLQLALSFLLKQLAVIVTKSKQLTEDFPPMHSSYSLEGFSTATVLTSITQT